MALTGPELLRLDASAASSFRELQDLEPKLAAKLAPVLDERLTSTVARLISGSEALRAAAGDLGVITLPDDLTTPVAVVAADALRAAIGEETLAKDPALREELAALEAGTTTTTTTTTTTSASVADVVGIDEPLRALPGLGTDLSRARVHRFADGVGLPAKTANALGELGALTAITETNLAALVDAGTLTAAAARKAGTAVALYDLFDSREELVQAFAAEGDDPVALTSLPAATWKQRIVESRTISVGGMSADDYVDVLRAKVDDRFRTSAIARDLKETFASVELDRNAELDGLRADERNTRVVGRDFGDLETGQLSATRLKKLRAAHEQATTLHRRYRGLGLGQLLDDTNSPAGDRIAEANRRIEQANEFLTDNPGALERNLLPASDDARGLKYPKGTSDDDRTRLLALGRTYQRALAVAPDLPTAQAMLDAGLGSATAIARQTPERLATLTGLGVSDVARLVDRASGIAIATGSSAGTIFDVGWEASASSR